MLFNSLVFWPFLAFFLTLYFATSGTIRLAVCLIGSYVFYGWWDWRFLGLIGALTIVNFWIGLRIAGAKSQKVRKGYVIGSACFSLGILALFKYADFFLESAAAVAGWDRTWIQSCDDVDHSSR